MVIGISDYDDPDIPDLEYADRDAAAFADFLNSPYAGLGGFDQDHVRLLTNRDASGVQIRTALFDFLARPGPDDIVYFFFAGHGMPAPGRPTDTQYLVPSDGDRTNFAGSAIRMADVENAVLNTRAQVVLFVDACHAGAIGAPGSTRGDEVNRINTEFIERIAAARPSGVSMIVAAHEGELAQEGTQWGGGHGVFTFHLLEALKGRGDRDEDGFVTLGEVYDYVRVQVARDTDNQQNPYASATFRQDLPIAVVSDVLLAEAPAVVDDDSGSLDIFATTDLTQRTWFAPDSVVTFVGSSDTIEVRLGSVTGERALPTRMRWVSSNPDVAGIDRFGVLEPRSPGATAITASVYTKEVDVLVRVLPTPSGVAFSPAEENLTISQFDEVRLSGVVSLPGGETVAGVLPNLVHTDTSVLSPRGNGNFLALREGQATIEAAIGTYRHRWRVTVEPPRLAIDYARSGALRLGDTLPMAASFVRENGSRIIEATGVSWVSSDTSVVRSTPAGLIATGLGRAVVRATSSTSRDSLDVFVLGDLLVSTRTPNGEVVFTGDLTNQRLLALLADEEGGRAATLSPDGRTIAFVSSREPGYPRIHLMNADGSDVRRLTPERSGILGLPIPLYQEHGPVWHPSGEQVYFVSNSGGGYDVYSAEVGSGDVVKITRSDRMERSVSVSPDGARIAFDQAVGAYDSDVWLALSDGTDASAIDHGEWMERRPVLAAGNRLLLTETPPNYRGGEALALYNATTGNKIRELVSAQRDHKIIFTVDPSGEHFAYSQVSRLGEDASPIIVATFEGDVIGSLTLPSDHSLLDLAWGAPGPARANAGETR